MDDTDLATLEKVRPLYDLLSSLGIRSTKTVWTLPAEEDRLAGESLSNEAYARWLIDLQDRGFEIASHGARAGSSTRRETRAALYAFRDAFGHFPLTHANHSQNRESLYWGAQRLATPILRAIYAGLRGNRFHGEDRNSPYFWGDICRDRIAYVRNFTFDDIVTSNCDPYAPYFDARQPYVRAWFSASNAPNAESFVRLLSPANLDRLERLGGWCVIYTHLACGFVGGGSVDARVSAVLTDLAKRNGWCVPVATLLAYVENVRGVHLISERERMGLEVRWLLGRAKQRT